MALLNLDLLEGEETVVNDANASNGDTINLQLLGSGTLVIDGVDVTLESVVGVGGLSSPTFAAQNGGTLTIDQGLLDADLLTSQTFELRDDGYIKLDASTLSVGLTETLLNRFDVVYSGAQHTGKFVYDPPTVALLALVPQTFNVQGMQTTDEFTIEGRDNLALDTTLFGGPDTAYRDGVLHLTSPGTPLVTETVNVEIPMTREQFDYFLANQDQFLTGGNTFIFPCFTRGTLILTDRGEIPVEELAVGDIVITRDNGPKAIRWIGSRLLDGAVLAAHPNLRPIRIKAGTLGEGLPRTDLVVSPQHRILVRSRIAQKMFATPEILVAAKQLLQVEGVDIAHDLAEVEYFHFLFDQHEIVISNGAETESLYPGDQALQAVGPAALREIRAIFPELDTVEVAHARLAPAGRPSRRLVVRHIQNGRPLVSAI